MRLAFPGSAVKTVAGMGWRGLTNGRLLREAAGKFDLFVTLDQNLEFQNPAASLALGILVLKTRFNDLATNRPQFGAIRDAAARTKLGQVVVLEIG